MEKRLMAIGLFVSMIGFGVLANAGMFSSQIETVQRWLGVGTTAKLATVTIVNNSDDEAIVIKANASQTENIIDIQNSAGTSLASFNSSGALSGAVAASTLTTTGNVTLGNAAADETTVTGGLILSEILAVDKVTADPCPGYASTYGATKMEGTIFYNNTSDYMCYCDGSTDDIKMNDNTTACF